MAFCLRKPLAQAWIVLLWRISLQPWNSLLVNEGSFCRQSVRTSMRFVLHSLWHVDKVALHPLLPDLNLCIKKYCIVWGKDNRAENLEWKNSRSKEDYDQCTFTIEIYFYNNESEFFHAYWSKAPFDDCRDIICSATQSHFSEDLRICLDFFIKRKPVIGTGILKGEFPNNSLASTTKKSLWCAWFSTDFVSCWFSNFLFLFVFTVIFCCGFCYFIFLIFVCFILIIYWPLLLHNPFFLSRCRVQEVPAVCTLM